MILSNNRFCIREAKCLLLADDTSIFCQNQNLKILVDYLNDEIRHVATWLKASKLLIDVKQKPRWWYLELNKTYC